MKETAGSSLHQLVFRDDLEGVRDFLESHGFPGVCRKKSAHPPQCSSCTSSSSRSSSSSSRTRASSFPPSSSCSCSSSSSSSSTNLNLLLRPRALSRAACPVWEGDCRSPGPPSASSSSSPAPQQRCTSPPGAWPGESDVTTSTHAALRDVLDRRDERGRTALHEAARFQRAAIARLLVEGGCDVTATDGQGQQALHQAVIRACPALVRVLLESGGCQLDALTPEGTSPLMTAALFDFVDIARLLVRAGASLESRDREGRSCLHIALEEGSQACALYLIHAGCDVNAVDRKGRSCLYLASHSHRLLSTRVVEALLTSGYECGKDASWLQKERQPSLFYNAPSLYDEVRGAACCTSTSTTSTTSTTSSTNSTSSTNANTCRRSSTSSSTELLSSHRLCSTLDCC